MPGREYCIVTNSSMNACYLNSESYAGEEEVVIIFRLLRKIFLSMINMEQDKEAITEDETVTRSDDIKHFYCVHHQHWRNNESKQRARKSTSQPTQSLLMLYLTTE